MKTFNTALFLTLVSSSSAFSPINRWALPLRQAVKAEFKVTLKNSEDGESVIDCKPNQFILDAAEEQGVNLPFDCRLGSCVACAGFVESGEVDNSAQFFLPDDMLEEGYTLTCAAWPLSDVTIRTYVADEVNARF